MKAVLRHIVMVVYDGVKNSVFESQVLIPLVSELQQDQGLEVTIVSFEPKKISLDHLAVHDRLNILTIPRLPFLGRFSLYFSVYHFVKFLKKIKNVELRARGPLAGFVVIKAVEFLVVTRIIAKQAIPLVMIQARGLAAEELRYATQKEKQRFVKKIKSFFMQKSLYAIEKSVYGYDGIVARVKRFFIESVSIALSDYLEREFNTDKNRITLAYKDIMPHCQREDVNHWRIIKRAALQIPAQAKVYVYSGSFKPWQCVEETIVEASKILAQDESAYFLILSLDEKSFEKALFDARIDRSRCRILSVPASELIEYLAAGDFGFLYREHDIINWVSRPTKLIEYQAAGLKIIHNKTVGCLVDSL